MKSVNTNLEASTDSLLIKMNINRVIIKDAYILTLFHKVLIHAIKKEIDNISITFYRRSE